MRCVSINKHNTKQWYKKFIIIFHLYNLSVALTNYVVTKLVLYIIIGK